MPTLDLRLSLSNSEHAHVTVYDAGGHCGALIMSRKTWDAIEETGDEITGPGDTLRVELTAAGVHKGTEAMNPPRSTSAGREED